MKINKHQNKKKLHSLTFRNNALFMEKNRLFFKNFSFSRSKTNFSKFSFVIHDRFDRKISEPTENNLSTAAELGIAVLNLQNFCNHASLLQAGKQSLVILSFAFPTHSSNLFPIVEAKFLATNYSTKNNKNYFVLIK